MPNPKVNEADYYQAVGEWLVERGLGERWAPNVAKSTLWSVDVLGGSQEGATVACELEVPGLSQRSCWRRRDRSSARAQGLRTRGICRSRRRKLPGLQRLQLE